MIWSTWSETVEPFETPLRGWREHPCSDLRFHRPWCLHGKFTLGLLPFAVGSPAILG
jgi:hypothetical protein